MQKKYIFYITLIALFIYAFYEIICIVLFKVSPGLPLDDVYIHLKYALNFTTGHIFEYNKGEPLPGSTSPLWVLLLSVFYLFTSNGILFSKILSILFHLLTTASLFYLSVYLFKNIKSLEVYRAKFVVLLSFFITTAFIFTGRGLWAGLSGMETMLFSFLLTASIYFHLKFLETKVPEVAEFLSLGLLSLTRPEGYLIFLILFSDIIFFRFRNKEIKLNYRKLIPGLIIYILIALPYPLFSYYTTGSLFPTTFNAVNVRTGNYQSFNYIRIMSIYLIRDNTIIAILYFVNIIFAIFNFKKYFNGYSLLRVLNLIVIVFPLLSAIIFPVWRHHGRYLIPVIPVLLLNSFITALLITEKIKSVKLRLRTSTVLGLMIIISAIPYFLIFAKHYAQNIDNINEMQVKAGYWIRDNLKNNIRIGLNDIGAIQYIADTKITDLSGIISPRLVEFRNLEYNEKADSVYNYLKRTDTRYLCIFNEWNTELISKYGDRLKLIETFAIPNNITCGSDKMFLYKILY